ncbi:MAG: anti-CBASS Acb1 family protein [Methylococcaceae bacterium]
MPKKISGVQQRIMAMASNLVDRMRLFSQLGLQYDGDRKIYQALGYKTLLVYTDYAAKYDRQDIAKAIINRPVSATWRGGITLLESDDKEETPLEKAWKELYDELKLHSKFARLDRLTGIGCYGVLLLGLDDVKNASTDFIKPVEGTRKLLYVKPLGEGSAIVDRWEQNASSERYGLPTVYKITLTNPGSRTSTSLQVHHSRVIHVAGELMESETDGTPRLKSVYNRLMDLEKLVGGSAEMFWRGARPGWQGEVGEDYQELDDDQKTDLQDQIEEYEHNLRRFLINKGIKFSSLDQQVSDPKPHVFVQLQMISAVTSIPLRKFIGSERGDLASSQDNDAWNELIQDRRDEFAEPLIVRAFIDRLIEYGVLPKASKDGYSVQWVDLWAPSEKEKAEIGKIRADALAAYGRNPGVEAFVPPEGFLRYFLGLKEEQIELIGEMNKQAIQEEGDDFGGEEE